MNRKKFIHNTSLVGLTSAFFPKLGFSQICDLTTEDILGPYYVENAPTRIIIASPNEPGMRLFVSGTVYANDCETQVPGALVEVWHANNEGCYSINQECDTGNPDNDEFNLRGKMLTDVNGQYGFETILAGHYGSRPKHIHYKVTHPDGTILVSQLYFEGDPFCDTDPWCSNAEDRIIPLIEDSNGLHGEFNIILESTQSGVISGDINTDGTVDILDVVLLVNTILYDESLDDTQLLAADINNDGLLDILDIVGIVNIILGYQRQTKDTILNSELLINNGNVILNSNENIAGLQLHLSGNYQIITKSLPMGWEFHHHNNIIILFNSNGTNQIPKILFSFLGDLNIDSNIITDRNLSRQSADIIFNSNTLSIKNAYPNPFNNSTVLYYELLKSGIVQIDVFDIRGRKIRNLFIGKKNQGTHQLKWNANNNSSGLYFIQITSSGHTVNTKVYLTK